MINGWNDWVKLNRPTNFTAYYRTGNAPVPIPETAVDEPSETVAFGEKDNDSGHFYMDYEDQRDVAMLAQTRHGGGPKNGVRGPSLGHTRILASMISWLMRLGQQGLYERSGK